MSSLIPFRVSRLLSRPFLTPVALQKSGFGTQEKPKKEISLNNQYLECFVKVLGRKANISEEILKELKALDTFVHHGPCKENNSPKGGSLQKISEWNAWKNVDSNLTTDEAKLKYIGVARACLKKFEEGSA